MVVSSLVYIKEMVIMTSSNQIDPAASKDIDQQNIGDGHKEIIDAENQELQISVRKIEFPVKPRGVLAE